MFSFEMDTDSEKLDIHVDIEGLTVLRNAIDSLIEQSKSMGHEHVHLMTPDWGGDTLTSEKLHEDNELIHHVKICCWNEMHQ